MTRRRLLVGLVIALVIAAVVSPVSAAVRRGFGPITPRKPALIALDRETGERRWRTVVSEESGRAELAFADHGVVAVVQTACQPTTDSLVELVAFDASTGDELWRVDLEKGFGPNTFKGSGGFGIEGPTVIVSRGTTRTRPSPDPRLQGLFTEVLGIEVLALDPKTGDQRWMLRRDGYAGVGGSRQMAFLSTESNVIPIPGAGSVAPTDATVLAINRRTGETVWEYSVASEGLDIVGTQVGPDTVGVFVVGVGNSANPDPDAPPINEERALDLSNGRERWRHSALEDPAFGKILANTVVRADYLGSTVRVAAYDVHSRAELWQREGYFNFNDQLAPNALLLFISDPVNNGGFNAIEALRPRDGRILWNRPVAGDELIGPIAADADLLIFNYFNSNTLENGNTRVVAALDTLSGRTRWTARIPWTVNGVTVSEGVYATDSCDLGGA